MELKTLEQYAIAKLEEQECKIEDLLDEIDEQSNTILQLRKALDYVADHCKIYKNAFGERWIRLESWEKYDNKEFLRLVESLGLDNEEEREVK